MNKWLSRLLIFVILIESLMLFSGCGKKFTGPYAEQQQAAYELRNLKYSEDTPAVIFNESYYSYGGIPVLFLQIRNPDEVPNIVAKVKEKFKGLDIPWLVTRYEELVYEELKDNEFKSLGLIIEGSGSDLFDYVPPFDDIDNLTRLNPVGMEYNKHLDEITSLPYIKELVVTKDASWIAKCPNLEKLTVKGVTDPSQIACIPSLKEITTADNAFGEAFAFSLYEENPSIETINGVPAKDYVFADGLDESSTGTYNGCVWRYKASRIDLTDYTEIGIDDMRLYGDVTIAGYNGAESASYYDQLARYLSGSDLAHINRTSELNGSVIRIRIESEVDGYYTNGRESRKITVNAEIIDMKNKTYARDVIYRATGDAVIVNGNGSTSGKFSLEKVCDYISDLIARSY